ncbi:hypothetical protein D3C80_1024250 [compost metagenome]
MLDKATAKAAEAVLSRTFNQNFALWPGNASGQLFADLNLARLAGIIPARNRVGLSFMEMSMAELSVNALSILGSMFSFGQVLTYHMIESIPSPEMQEALDKLVAAGMVEKEQGLPDMTRKAVRYRAANDVDLKPYQKEQWDKLADGTAPSIRVFIKRSAA